MANADKRAQLIAEFKRYDRDCLFHFSDDRNTPLILENGGIYSAELVEAMGLEVPVWGGDQNSRNSDKANGMDKYVHM